MKLFLTAMAITLPALAACGGGAGAPGSQGHDAMEMDVGAIGEPGTEADVTQTVEVTALDSLRFDPEDLEVDQGETVSFVVTNEGRLDHEFVLGDDSYQSHMHQSGSMDDHESNGIFLGPGQTAEIVWHFTESGEVLFACHVNDHYTAGMVGSVTVR